MYNREVFLETEVSKATSGQNAKEFSGVHCLHISVLSEAVCTVLIGVENREEAPIHVERLVVEPLEDFPIHVGFQGVLCVVGPDYGVGEGGGGGGIVCGGCSGRGSFY